MSSTVDELVDIVASSLGLGERRSHLNADTALVDGLPEFDSLAVLEVATQVEDRFGIQLDDDDVNAETFATIGSLAALVDARREG